MFLMISCSGINELFVSKINLGQSPEAFYLHRCDHDP